MSIHLLSSKTDQYRQGADIVISRTGSNLCPVTKLEEYYTIAKQDPNSVEKLFRGIVASKNGDRLRSTGSISYSRVWELVLQKIESLGHDLKLFGLHSFRSRGASLAANVGVPDHLFKRHGRWRSEAAKDGYIKDSLLDRLSVSKSLRM